MWLSSSQMGQPVVKLDSRFKNWAAMLFRSGTRHGSQLGRTYIFSTITCPPNYICQAAKDFDTAMREFLESVDGWT